MKPTAETLAPFRATVDESDLSDAQKGALLQFFVPEKIERVHYSKFCGIPTAPAVTFVFDDEATEER